MMIHEFFLSNTSTDPNFDFAKYHEDKADILLDDDLYQYIRDSLHWISSFNPSKAMKPQTGLNHTGVTVIRRDGAKSLQEISRAWADLFRQSPKVLKLTGSYTWLEGKGARSGDYQTLTYDRDEIVEIMERLEQICSRVSDGDGSAFIMHHGI